MCRMDVTLKVRKKGVSKALLSPSSKEDRSASKPAFLGYEIVRSGNESHSRCGVGLCRLCMTVQHGTESTARKSNKTEVTAHCKLSAPFFYTPKMLYPHTNLWKKVGVGVYCLHGF